MVFFALPPRGRHSRHRSERAGECCCSVIHWPHHNPGREVHFQSFFSSWETESWSSEPICPIAWLRLVVWRCLWHLWSPAEAISWRMCHVGRKGEEEPGELCLCPFSRLLNRGTSVPSKELLVIQWTTRQGYPVGMLGWTGLERWRSLHSSLAQQPPQRTSALACILSVTRYSAFIKQLMRQAKFPFTVDEKYRSLMKKWTYIFN